MPTSREVLSEVLLVHIQQERTNTRIARHGLIEHDTGSCQRLRQIHSELKKREKIETETETERERETERETETERERQKGKVRGKELKKKLTLVITVAISLETGI
jgi:uncharacterized protein involved in tolerance to divalent cations